jgi:hypothetical protein
MFFDKQEVDFFKNISIGMSLLFTYNSVTDTVRQFIFKFSLQIIKYASNELYADNIKCFEEFLKSSEVKSRSLQKEALERKKAAVKFFRIYNEKVDQMMQKVLTAKYVSDVLASYLEYIYLSNGKSIIEIYKIESIISQFLSIEPLIKMKRFYSIWPYLTYISHLKQDNQLILEISATLKIFYNLPNFQNGLACIKCLTVYLIDDQKKVNGMNQLSDKIMKLELCLENKNSTLESISEIILDKKRLDALKQSYELLRLDEKKPLDMSSKYTVSILLTERLVKLFNCDESATSMIHECRNILSIESEMKIKSDEIDYYTSVNQNSLPKLLDLVNSIINFHSINITNSNEIQLIYLKNYIQSMFHATYWFKENPNPLNFFTHISSAIVSYLACISNVYHKDSIKVDEVIFTITKDLDDVLKSFDDKIKFYSNENTSDELMNSLNKDNKSFLGDSQKEIDRLNNCLISLENDYIKELKKINNINLENNISLERVEELGKNYFNALPFLTKASNRWLSIFEAFSDIIETIQDEKEFRTIGKKIFHTAVSILHYSNAFDHIYNLIAQISIYEVIPDLQNIKEKLDRLKIDDDIIKKLISRPLVRTEHKKNDEDMDYLNFVENLKESQNNKSSSIKDDDDFLKLIKDDYNVKNNNQQNFEFSEHFLINKLNEAAKNFMRF